LFPRHLKQDGAFFVKGDNVNLPEINNKISSIDVFHYDSDKSYPGRVSVLKMLDGKITNKTWIIFDDIQDNSFFYDLVTNNNYSEWKIFEFEGKWVGIICPE
jgi:hypoxanthine-guanine phosphoribosyltransferase